MRAGGDFASLCALHVDDLVLTATNGWWRDITYRSYCRVSISNLSCYDHI